MGVGASLMLGGCQPGILNPAGPVGLAQRTILFDSMLIMMAIVGPTIIATLAFAWWFREGNPKARRRPDWSYSGQIELVTWSIPALTVFLLGGVAWIGSHALDPAKSLPSDRPALEVQVVSLDWKWLFIYPGQQVASVNELVIPAGQPVHFSLTSGSVMNAFFVPQLGSMIYTMNGMTSQLNLQADKPGEFQGLSSHYSGDGFSDMHFKVRALDTAGFEKWVQETKQAPALDRDRYASLAQRGLTAPGTFGSVAPGLFEAVVDQSIAPVSGLPAETGGKTPAMVKDYTPAALKAQVPAMGKALTPAVEGTN